MMTDAPDPGLTDLIAAALGDKIMHTNGSGDRNRAYAAHVALVVEQHTNGRIAELAAERDAALSKVTSVEMALERAHGDEIFTDDIWAALEGEQQ